MNSPLDSLPPLKSLRAFEAAARHLSFRLAAEELHVTQAAVAQQVRALEAWLGVQLFERLPRRLALTDRGLSYSHDVRQALERIALATTAVRLPAPNSVTLSVTPTFASKWLMPRLPAFVDAHPGIDLRVQASERLVSFHLDGVDMAVRQTRLPPDKALDSLKLFPQELVAVCAPSLSSSSASKNLLHDAHDLWPDFYRQVLNKDLPRNTKALRFNQTSLAIDAALSGQGMALAPRCFVEDDLRQGRLILAFEGSMAAGGDFYLVWPRDSLRSDAARAVKHWLVEQAG